LRLRPRSIRTRLGLAFLIAVGSILAVQILHACQDLRRTSEESDWCLRLAEAPFGERNREAALLRVTDWAQEGLNDTRRDLIVSAAVALAGLATAFVIANRVARSTRRLARAASAMAVGDYRRRISIRTGDELESLGESFNALGESLLKHEQALKGQSEMLSGMLEAARAASTSLDAKECSKAIARAVCGHLGSSDAAVFRKDRADGGIRVAGKSGKRHGADWKRLAAHSADSGEYLVVAEQDCGGDGQTEAILVGAPLTTGAETIGAIVARFGEGLSREDLRLGSLHADVLRTFAIHAAAALANAEIHSQTTEYSEVLEGWVEHVSAVMQVTTAIAPTLTLDEALDALARATAETMSTDECVIFLPDREGDLIMRSCFATGERRENLHRARLAPGQSVSGQAFVGKRCVSCYDAQNSDDELTRELCKVDGLGGILGAPLMVGDEAIGVIALYCFEPRKFSEREIQLLMSIAMHAAVVVRNAKLYTMEATIAEKLQRSLISEAPEQCRGLEFAGRYVAALEEASIGGDFYDVTALPNGKVAVVIADVSGKGLGAAIHLAACKYMLKALVCTDPDDPAAVLGELNEAINYCFNQDFFVTMFHAVIDPEKGSIVFANAGHPPAFLISENGNMHSCLASSGIPLGAGPACKYENGTVNTKPGDVLLLYTDGVTDAVKAGSRLDLEGLHKMVFELGRCSGEQLVNRLIECLNRDCDPTRKDDVAVLAVSFGSMAGSVGGKSVDGQRHIATGTR
jgi:serine phosphatase RsbU (regulator of sigma subunit)/HAMP domain-containing protein